MHWWILLEMRMMIWCRYFSWCCRTSCSKCLVYESQTIQPYFGCKRESSSFWFWSSRNFEETSMQNISLNPGGWCDKDTFMCGVYYVESSLYSPRSLGTTQEFFFEHFLGWRKWNFFRIWCLEFWLHLGWDVQWRNSMSYIVSTLVFVVENSNALFLL